jgi:Fic family protein
MNLEKPPTKTNPLSLNKKDLLLLSNTEVLLLINKCNDEYLYWDKVKYQNTEKEISDNQLWNLLKISRIINSKLIHFGKYSFSINITDKMNMMLHHLDMEMGGNIQNISQLSNAEKQFYILSSLQEEAIASSKMEGASTTRKIAKEMLRKVEKPKDLNEKMIMNNFETMQFLVNEKNNQLTPQLVLKIHKEITKKTLDNQENEGSLRNNNDLRVVNSIIGEIVHTPPNYDDLSSLLNEICDFCNNDNYFDFFIHPIVKAIILHFLIAFIHPFVDGNGRTARSLVYWYLLKKDYWLIKYISISRIIHKTKSKYEKSFLYTEIDDYDLSYFINYNLLTLIKAKEELKHYLDRKIKEKNNYNRFIGIDSITEREAQILNKFNKDPDKILTIIEVQNLFSISNQTARTDLQKLVKLNYLKKLKLNNRKFGFAVGIKLIES